MALEKLKKEWGSLNYFGTRFLCPLKIEITHFPYGSRLTSVLKSLY